MDQDKVQSIEQLNAVKGLKLIHLNIRSLPKKMDQLRLIMSHTSIDVLTISESWLKSHLNLGLKELEGFVHYRLDRGTRKGAGK